MANSSAAAGPSSSSSPQAGGGGDSPQQRRPPRAGSDPLLIVCGCFSVVTAATALLCVAVNVLSAVHAFRAGSNVSLVLPPSLVRERMFRAARAVTSDDDELNPGGACALLCFPDIRGHIPVLRGGVLALRRRPRDRMGIHHQVLEGPLSSAHFSIWNVRDCELVALLLSKRWIY